MFGKSILKRRQPQANEGNKEIKELDNQGRNEPERENNRPYRERLHDNLNDDANAPANSHNRGSHSFELPDFLQKAENEHLLQMYIRMRQRHIADGSVALNVEPEDIADNNLELYDNKGINIEFPTINDNLKGDQVVQYIESINRDKFYKVKQMTGGDKITRKTQDIEEKAKPLSTAERTKKRSPLEKRISKLSQGSLALQYKPTQIDIARFSEDEMFSKFDEDLHNIITKTTSKVSLLFLFTQGILAGLSLANLLFLLEYLNATSFIEIYAGSVRELFNFIHTLTFSSLVGNGIKFISAYQKYKLTSARCIENKQTVSLKRSMIFSGIILIFFTLIFAIELYLATFIPPIFYSKFTSLILITEDSFKAFQTLYLVCNVIAIVLFILNIFDVNLKEEDDKLGIAKNEEETYNAEDPE